MPCSKTRNYALYVQNKTQKQEIMKRQRTIICLTGLALFQQTSCTDLDEEKEDYLIIDPVEPMFQFDKDGIPYYWETPRLSAEYQEKIENELIGYGWQWRHTNEILADGYVSPQDYWTNRYGGSPTSYYFRTDQEMTDYFYSDAYGQKAYLTHDYALDLATGTLTSGSEASATSPSHIYLRIWAIYAISGKWHMDCIVPLGQRTDEKGELKTVWGASHYVRMSQTELNTMQEQYTFDISSNK